MSRTSPSALGPQWDPHREFNIHRDGRCVGWAHSKGRRCQHTVNRADMDAFYDLLDKMSFKQLDADALQSDLWQLASYGLCLQVHRSVQKDSMVEKWTRMINTAVRRAEARAEPPHGRTNTSSTTASFANTVNVRVPATQSPSSLSPLASASTTRTDLDPTLQCLQTLILRLANLQVPNTPRLDPVPLSSHSPATAVSSLHLSETSGIADSRTTRSSSSSTSHGSVLEDLASPQASLGSSSLDSALSRNRRRRPHVFADSPSDTPSPALQTPSSSSSPQTSSALPVVAPPASSRDTSRGTPLQQQSSNSRMAFMVSLPRCTTAHVRRRPVSDDCPICFDAMLGQPALDWCKGGCGQSVHRECMDIWRANCVANGTDISCTMCRTGWVEGCEC